MSDSDYLAELAAACRKAAHAVTRLAPVVEGGIEEVLVMASRINRSRGHQRTCTGCEGCAEPFPVLSGDVA